ncbi:MAG: GDSL-type esterase/lipase family protein [Kineothrix sp.]|jgi:lysophospholipase L1-like esterase|nr:hypothetical protein [Lachnospiraceae bacterium]MCX4344927.1 GDSL-type esterase/lipase family protein [Kineothrix sp.]
MKKNWWRYGIAVGLVMVAIIGSFGIKALAAGKKTMRTGADIVTGASEIESIKIVKNTYQTEGEKGILGTPEADKTEAESGNGEKTEEGESGNEADAEGGKTGETAEEGTSEDGVVSDEEAGEASESGEKTESGEEGEGAEENAEEIDAYFDDSVFIGDSIMLGFRNYAMKRQDTFLSRMNFLAAGSFSANNALWDVNDESVHPVYQGEQRQVWESVSLMGSKRVFLMLGMNDLNITGVEGSCEKYEELIGKIKEKNPDAEIIIMSMTYVLKGKETGKLQNDIIREFNGMLETMAEKNGWGYVNVAEALADGNGDLAEEYCSDGFAHQNPEAYDVWVSVLRKYADEHLDK